MLCAIINLPRKTSRFKDSCAARCRFPALSFATEFGMNLWIDNPDLEGVFGLLSVAHRQYDEADGCRCRKRGRVSGLSKGLGWCVVARKTNGTAKGWVWPVSRHVSAACQRRLRRIRVISEGRRKGPCRKPTLGMNMCLLIADGGENVEGEGEGTGNGKGKRRGSEGKGVGG